MVENESTNYFLGYDKSLMLIISTLLIGGEYMRLLLREACQRETPQALAPRRLPDRPRKAKACNGNQQQSLTEPFFISVLEHLKFKTFHS